MRTRSSRCSSRNQAAEICRYPQNGHADRRCRCRWKEVAGQLHLDQVYTELLPADKVDRVESLLKQKSEKGMLAFVGDGINDAPVLARADVGIAMGGLGSDAAIELLTWFL